MEDSRERDYRGGELLETVVGERGRVVGGHAGKSGGTGTEGWGVGSGRGA